MEKDILSIDLSDIEDCNKIQFYHNLIQSCSYSVKDSRINLKEQWLDKLIELIKNKDEIKVSDMNLFISLKYRLLDKERIKIILEFIERKDLFDKLLNDFEFYDMNKLDDEINDLVINKVKSIIGTDLEYYDYYLESLISLSNTNLLQQYSDTLVNFQYLKNLIVKSEITDEGEIKLLNFILNYLFAKTSNTKFTSFFNDLFLHYHGYMNEAFKKELIKCLNNEKYKRRCKTMLSCLFKSKSKYEGFITVRFFDIMDKFLNNNFVILPSYVKEFYMEQLLTAKK